MNAPQVGTTDPDSVDEDPRLLELVAAVGAAANPLVHKIERDCADHVGRSLRFLSVALLYLSERSEEIVMNEGECWGLALLLDACASALEFDPRRVLAQLRERGVVRAAGCPGEEPVHGGS